MYHKAKKKELLVSNTGYNKTRVGRLGLLLYITIFFFLNICFTFETLMKLTFHENVFKAK